LASAIADPVVPRPRGLVNSSPRINRTPLLVPPPTSGYVLQMSADNHTAGHAGGVLYGAGIVAINARLLKMKKEDKEDER